MSKKSYNAMIKAGFIPGIYNFCDRWCEKCNQQNHCISFVVGKKLNDYKPLDLLRVRRKKRGGLWETLKKLFDSTLEVLNVVADERGISVNDIFEAENVNEGLWEEAYRPPGVGTKEYELVEQTDIVRMGMLYEKAGDQCVTTILQSFCADKEQGLGSEWDEAWDRVIWDLNLIKAKMRQALFRKYCSGKEKRQDEYNGLAKVALLIIDRNLEAWQVVARYYPDCRKEIKELNIILEQLRFDVEEKFPEARTFLRPGFDRPVFVDKKNKAGKAGKNPADPVR